MFILFFLLSSVLGAYGLTVTLRNARTFMKSLIASVANADVIYRICHGLTVELKLY